ncbi:RNA-directed DNA polymerase [Paenibacillus sp. SYP-B4298]|uniref:RNA-directed DNA polymerase n=1 Tax=Paenibacillus sp. SYP-B4298 TaxID=2996034 RepID=UPI0022DE6483|nr:RNA-directed DNA polymerase [Paenibacillus sp. SYP-B4298]
MLKIKEKSLNWSLQHINRFGDSYVFPNPFEFDAINENWQEVKKYLLNIDVFSNGVRPYRTTITPKSSLGFRICTQLDPLDSLVYNALIYEIHEEIENKRVPIFLDTVYSFRLSPDSDGSLFDPDYNWKSYEERTRELIESKEYSYVVTTDITDFYPSIYLHNIETHLRECVRASGKNAHAETLINIIKAMHISQTHKGLPIGPQISRPIAELILNEIDHILIDNNIMFIRYVDDFRLFCRSENEAYKSLAFLAQKLYDILNLKLNEQKTKILTTESFMSKHFYLFTEREKDRIINEFYELLDKIGAGNDFYGEIDISSLNDDDTKKLHELNIFELLEEELSKDEIDLAFAKFLIGNLARFDNTEVADLILTEKNMRKLFPILKTIINHLERVRSFSEEQKHQIGEKVINLIQNSFMSELEFNRSWLLHLFSKNDEWNNEKYFSELLKIFDDNFTRRELILNLGRAKNFRYFRENKFNNISDPWVKRAFLVAVSCLPPDERNPYYKSRSLTQRDILDQVVEKWAQKKPF